MRLITHNLLRHPGSSDPSKGYPLAIEPETVTLEPVDFNPEFVTCMLPKLDYAVLRSAAARLSALVEPALPAHCRVGPTTKP